jgi:hypothetical protein
VGASLGDEAIPGENAATFGGLKIEMSLGVCQSAANGDGCSVGHVDEAFKAL